MTTEGEKIFKIYLFLITTWLEFYQTPFLVCCKFLATQSATSDDISIEAGNEVEGKLDVVGSWDGSLKVEFTDNAYANKKTDAAIFGETHYIKVSWTVGTSPLAKKVKW